MMNPLKEKDKKQITDHGLTPEQALQDIEMIQKGSGSVHLVRPARIGDGIKVVTTHESDELEELFYGGLTTKTMLKFVPASGAATRMFKFLLSFYHDPSKLDSKEIEKKANEGDKDCQEFIEFFKGIQNFAFYDDLKNALKAENKAIRDLIKKKDFSPILEVLLSEKGMNYEQLPKALIKFHSYKTHGRTALEEHLIEANNYCIDQADVAHIHFTVPPESTELIKEYISKAITRHLGKDLKFKIDYSIQKASTDKICLDLDNNLVHEKDGSVLFRPGGHGALLENLNEIDADIIFVKNIDNVAPDSLKAQTYRYKRLLAGYLIKVQNIIFSYLKKLDHGDLSQLELDGLFYFLENEISLEIPVYLKEGNKQVLYERLKDKLNRPIRVCGMVKNAGEPGGGPFWVKNSSQEASLQIVESSQIDLSSKDQEEIFQQSTHFNPVDLICAVKNYQGELFNLKEFVDYDSYFVSQKSHDGKELKALEWPGLWNGSMAHWITIFVEVPTATFSPVKSVNDLLRKEHQN